MFFSSDLCKPYKNSMLEEHSDLLTGNFYFWDFTFTTQCGTKLKC